MSGVSYGCELDAGRGEWSDFRPVGGWFVGGGQVSHFWVVAFPEAAVGGRFVKAAVGTSRLDFIHVAPRFLVSGYRIEYYMMGGGMQGFFLWSFCGRDASVVGSLLKHLYVAGVVILYSRRYFYFRQG